MSWGCGRRPRSLPRFLERTSSRYGNLFSPGRQGQGGAQRAILANTKSRPCLIGSGWHGPTRSTGASRTTRGHLTALQFRGLGFRYGGRSCVGDSGLRARLRRANLRRAFTRVRKEFRFGLQPVLEVLTAGSARGFPKLVSPLRDLVGVDLTRVLAWFCLTRCCVHGRMDNPDQAARLSGGGLKQSHPNAEAGPCDTPRWPRLSYWGEQNRQAVRRPEGPCLAGASKGGGPAKSRPGSPSNEWRIGSTRVRS